MEKFITVPTFRQIRRLQKTKKWLGFIVCDPNRHTSPSAFPVSNITPTFLQKTPEAKANHSSTLDAEIPRLTVVDVVCSEIKRLSKSGNSASNSVSRVQCAILRGDEQSATRSIK